MLFDLAKQEEKDRAEAEARAKGAIVLQEPKAKAGKPGAASDWSDWLTLAKEEELQRKKDAAEAAAAKAGVPPIEPGISDPRAALTAQYVAAGWDPSRLPWTKKSMEAQDEAINAMGKANIAEAEAREAGNLALAERLDEQAGDIQTRNFAYRGAELERTRRFEEKRQKANELSEQASALKIEPGRIFQNDGAPLAILSIIGGALGGMLQARIGGENTFIKTLDNVIDRDIAAQRTAIEQQRWRAGQARTDLADLREQLGDERAADLQQADRAYAAIETEIKAALVRNQNPILRARGEQMLADLAGRRAQTLMGRDEAMRVAGHMVGPPAGVTAENALRIVQWGAQTRIAPTEPEAVELRERAGVIAQIQRAHGEALRLRKSIQADPVSMNAYEAYEDLGRLEENTMKMIELKNKQGVLRDAEREAAKNDVTKFRKYIIMPGLSDRLNNSIEYGSRQFGQDFQDELNARAPEIGVAGYRATPTGIKPAAGFVGQTKVVRGNVPVGKPIQ